MAKTSIMGLAPAPKAEVYSAKPRSVPIWFSVSSRYFPECGPSMSVLPKPIWGRKCPVSLAEMAMAGTRKAVMSTQYWATWVQVMPFMPPMPA